MKQFRQRLLCCCLAHGAAPPPGWTASFGEQAWADVGAARGKSCPRRDGRGPCTGGGPSAFLLGFLGWPGLTERWPTYAYLLSDHDWCWMVERTATAAIAAYLTWPLSIADLEDKGSLADFLPAYFGVSVAADRCLPTLVGPPPAAGPGTADALLPSPPAIALPPP